MKPRRTRRSGAAAPVIDAAANLHGYKRLSRIYDLLAVPWLTNGVRREAVAQLDLRPGDTLLDLGCGTGLNLRFLVDAVGPAGRVVGVDLSPHQLARARERAVAADWENVTLVEANAEMLSLDEQLDGILSSYTHDIMTSSLAVERAVAHLKPGGRFVALGFVRPTGWRAPLNLIFVAGFKMFRIPINWNAETSGRPWTNLERALGRVTVKRRFFGTWYRAVGTRSAASNTARS